MPTKKSAKKTPGVKSAAKQTSDVVRGVTKLTSDVNKVSRKTPGVKSVKKPVKKTTKKTPGVKLAVSRQTPGVKSAKKSSAEKVHAQKPKAEKLKELWTTGKRKSSIARVQFFSQGKGEISINNRSVKDYFPIFGLQKCVAAPLKLLTQDKTFQFKIMVHGGGIRGQAEAVRLGIARALVLFNPEWRKPLKKAGFLRRDPRKKERKKPGLKRARRAPQWQKR